MSIYRRHSFIRLPRIWWPILTMLLIYLVLLIVYAAGPWPLWVRVANVGSRSFSVGWVTQQPTRGCIWVLEGEKIPKNISVSCGVGDSLTHLLTASNLKEAQTYRVLVVQGWRIYPTTIKSVMTFIDKPTPPAPVPGYGTVVDLNGERIPQALVYVYPTNTNKVYPEAVIANDQGNYAVDLSFYGSFPEWVIEGGSGPGQWDVMPVSGEATAPFPPLEVSTYE